jgi:hypothetical protein
MSTLTSYNGLQIATPAPTGYGGNAVNNNFKALATRIDTVDPTAGADSTQGFSAGSRWYNSSSGNEWICLSAAPGAASWAVITGVLGDYLPLSGGTLTGNLNCVGNNITNLCTTTVEGVAA